MTDGLPAWFTGTPLATPGPGRVFFTTQTYPIFYMQITKCGCTYLRNLIYHLDHGTAHPAGSKVHNFNHDFAKADLIPVQTLVNSAYLFTVVRDPVDRFLSLYFDKIADITNEKDAAMRRRVGRKAGLDLTADMDLAAHRRNALLTINWFGRNLERGTKGRVNPHWQRQQERLGRAAGLAPRLLTLEGLPWQLPALLQPIIPDIGDQMSAVRVRNASKKPFSRAEMATPELVETIHQVYAQDLETYQQARKAWGDAPKGDG